MYAGKSRSDDGLAASQNNVSLLEKSVMYVMLLIQ